MPSSPPCGRCAATGPIEKREFQLSRTVVETVYGKYSKYEIVRDSGMFSTSVYLLKDGKPAGSYSSVEAAVAAAKSKG